MRAYDVPEDVIKVDPRDFSIHNRLKPEYVLKVNNIPPKKPAPQKNVPTKKRNPNPKNLPAVRKKKKSLGKKLFLDFLFFVLIFIIAVVAGYNAVFYLFTI